MATRIQAPLTPKRVREPRRLGRIRYSAVELLIALVLFFFITPFSSALPYGKLIEAVMLTLVLISAVVAIGARGPALLHGGILSAVALGFRWIHHFYPWISPLWLSQFCALIFLGYVVLQILQFVLRSPHVNSEVICAAVSAYLILGFIWATGYMLVERFSPGSFSFLGNSATSETMDSFNALYFSFVVLTTIGFGDIAPSSRIARMLAITEAITGLFYVTILISRLVAMYTPSPKVESDSPDSLPHP